MNISFEKRTCGRCNGAGRFNHYAHVYGGVCFGCGGSGTKLTRNGSTAKKAYDASMTIEASELEVGMVVWDTGMDGKDRRRRIDAINPSTGVTKINGVVIPTLDITYASTDSTWTHTMSETNKVRMALSPTNRHLAIEALAKLKGATITETEKVTA